MSAIPVLVEAAAPPEGPLLAGRYRLVELLSNRCGLERFLARDESLESLDFVQLVREPLPPGDDLPIPGDGSVWPSLAWEERLRTRCRHLGLPRVLARFNDQGYGYIVLEVPVGVNLWDAWEDPAWPVAEKFGWLIQLADLLQVLHAAGAILENLRPDQVVLLPNGQVVFTDTGNLLPLPVPADVPVLGTYSTAPELLTGAWIDARSDLYCFGAMIYALLLGRELTDLDFHAPGVPKSYLERFPDVHPHLGRLLSKTFTADVDRRFPTSEGGAEDPSGFHELIALLDQCQRTLGRSRLQIAAWSTTGMVRTGNEDAFAVLKNSVGGQDELSDCALVLLADGMGGSAAGEVAAALAIRSVHETLGSLPPFGQFGLEPGTPPVIPTPQSYRTKVVDAIREANKAVYLASRQGIGRRGMGCTVEVVYTDGKHLVIGHVGDSRTYRFSRGKLTQLTTDQTYVNRLVELGDITLEQAEVHPRRAELQQAVGGWSDIDPQVVVSPFETGDWVIVCSDGLTGMLKPPTIQAVLERSNSAESAARRLVNLANLYGAADNVTVVVLHAV
ncbi:MAG: protein phosphatase 2C domain-containing protein [Gemmataceae bacterium]|nr:protein phosphatase 2C domain-containing protein [Gemmataceae bacterium]